MPEAKDKIPYTPAEVVDILWKAVNLTQGDSLLIPVPSRSSQRKLLDTCLKQLSIMEQIAPEIAKRIFLKPAFLQKRFWLKIQFLPPQQTLFVLSPDGSMSPLPIAEKSNFDISGIGEEKGEEKGTECID